MTKNKKARSGSGDGQVLSVFQVLYGICELFEIEPQDIQIDHWILFDWFLTHFLTPTCILDHKSAPYRIK